MTDAALDSSGLIVRQVSKRFGNTQALSNVGLQVAPGAIVALLGENGAGKSTLLKILSGAERPDQGTMTLRGDPYHPQSPHDARRCGVAMIYQEQALAPHLDAVANICLGSEDQLWGWLQPAVMRERALRALHLVGRDDLPLAIPVSQLDLGRRQLVEIARAVAFDAQLLILDEPTSSLARPDAERLFQLLRRLRSEGRSILYVSHFLEEVQPLADNYVVLRDGCVADSGRMQDATTQHLIRAMTGKAVGELYPRVPHSLGEVVFEVTDWAGRRLPKRASFRLRRGEILGIFGLVGAGRTELLRGLFGLDPRRQGKARHLGTSASPCRPDLWIRRGVGMVSEDRKLEGLSLAQSIEENLTCGYLGPYVRWHWLRLGRRRAATRQWLARLGVAYSHPAQPVGSLSGGNQQKVAIGRLLHQDADILLLDEPTRGVDVASKAAVYQLLGDLAARGKSIVFVSSYLPELLGTCDTLAVMARGTLSATRPVADWITEEVLELATMGGAR